MEIILAHVTDPVQAFFCHWFSREGT